MIAFISSSLGRLTGGSVDAESGGARPADRALRRGQVRWSLKRRFTQFVLGVLYDLKPGRLWLAPIIFLRWLAYLLRSDERRIGAPIQNSPAGAVGFLGLSSDMSIATLRDAYWRGAYPMMHYGPVRWYAPQTRAVIKIADFQPRNDVKRKLRKQAFHVTFDRQPPAVLAECGAPRPGQWPLTWITPKVMDAYLDLHSAGLMHTVEVWDNDGNLVGGLFGTSVGPIFVVESLFYRATDASKYGLAVLIAHLRTWGYTHVDCKLMTKHLASLGCEEMPAGDYLAILENWAGQAEPTDSWSVNPNLARTTWTSDERPPPLH